MKQSNQVVNAFSRKVIAAVRRNALEAARGGSH